MINECQVKYVIKCPFLNEIGSSILGNFLLDYFVFNFSNFDNYHEWDLLIVYFLKKFSLSKPYNPTFLIYLIVIILQNSIII